jgi:hypothetical protein
MQSHATGTISELELNPLPDVILPSQFFPRAKSFSSEQRLLLAVLLDAINILGDYRGSSSSRKRKSFSEASAWVFDESIEGPMSFDHVCDALGVHATDLRKWLSRLVEKPGSPLPRLRLKEAGRAQRVATDRVGRMRCRTQQRYAREKAV